MTVGSSSVSRQKKKMKSPLKGKTKSRNNLTPSAGTRVPVGRILHSGNGKPTTCHQCRHNKGDSLAVWCTNKSEKCSSMYCHRCLLNRYGEKAEEIACLRKWSCPKCQGICNCSVCMKRRGHEPTGNLKTKAAGFSSASEMLIKRRKIVPNLVIAPEKELTCVAGIDMDSEQVGNALQFLEFCTIFGKILDIKKGEPEYVLQDLLDGQTGSRGKFSANVQFHIYLLQIIQKERGEECAVLSLSNAKLKSSWFDLLKKFLYGSQAVLKAHGLNCLDSEADYVSLNSSEKLMLLNLLCDEVLGIKKVRNLVGGKSIIIAAKDKDKKFKQTRRYDIDNAIIPRHQSSDTVRTDPILVHQGGYVFWKLNAFGEADILCQNVGKGSRLSLDEKWSSVDAAGKEAIEKHISLLREI